MVLYLFLGPWFGMSSSLGSMKFIGISWDGRKQVSANQVLCMKYMKNTKLDNEERQERRREHRGVRDSEITKDRGRS